MEQRVAVTLATVWLASIVGASVPSGETTAFSTPPPPGPSPDQYTPLHRNPRYYSQDDYNQDWMNDESSRIKVANRHAKSDRGKTTINDSDRSIESPPNEFFNRKRFDAGRDPLERHSFQTKDMKTPSELDRKAMRLSSMKVAFDEPIDSEIPDDSSEEYWNNDEIQQDGEMQQDAFVSDDTFEDEGPGSVEVYKLDLYKDRSILSPKPARKNYIRNKSKIPKKVETVDQIIWKSKDPEETKQHRPKTSSRFDHHSLDEFSLPSRSLKERIFGVGGVPELQVGCEGVEDFQREKRSNSDGSHGINASPSARATPVYLEADYSEEELDVIGGTDELFKILAQGSTTVIPLDNENRGDMNPRIKTPADLEAEKDKLPTRGDLGPSSDPNIENATQTHRQRHNSNGNEHQLSNRRRLQSLEGELAENVRNKRSTEWGYGESEGYIGKRKKHRGGRKHREGGKKRHYGRERKRSRKGNEISRRNEATDENGRDNVKKPKDHIVKRKSSTLLRQLPTRENRRNGRQLNARWRSGPEGVSRRIPDELDRKLELYNSRRTPIPRNRSAKDNQQGKPPGNEWRGTRTSGIPAPENLTAPVHPDHDNQRNDEYAENRRRLEEQKRSEEEYTSRPVYDKEETTKRPQENNQGRRKHPSRSKEEIARLDALPVSAYITIDEKKSDDSIPEIGSRFGEDETIKYQGLNPMDNGAEVAGFPSTATTKAPVVGPSPCVWAVMICCSNQDRLASCFEAKGCSHGFWDDPCSQDKVAAALQMVNKYYVG